MVISGVLMLATIPLAGYYLGVLDKMLRDLELLLSLAVAFTGFAVGVWVQWRHGDAMRLIVDAEGVRLHSTAPRWWGLNPWASWTVRWEDVTGVAVVERWGVIRIKRKRGPIGLRVHDWIDDNVAADWEAQSAARRSEARSTALWRALDDAGLFRRVAAAPRRGALSFDLFGHRGTRAALVVAAVLVGYGLLDGYLAREAWPEWSWDYLLPHILAGTVAAVLTIAALLSRKAGQPVPRTVMYVLALTIGMTASIASWHGLIRVNQVAGGPLVSYAYVRDETCMSLVPVSEGLPVIEYSELARDYWCTYPQEHKHTVPVRRGLFGLYQVDLTEHTDAIRAFRGSQPIRAKGTIASASP